MLIGFTLLKIHDIIFLVIIIANSYRLFLFFFIIWLGCAGLKWRSSNQMDKVIRQGIVKIIRRNKKLLRIPIRQKAKFEGWLKFELAHYLEEIGMDNVEVESKRWNRRTRTDITFFDGGKPYSVELKTPNTNWHVEGIYSNGRPITKNIQSIIDDAIKLNSPKGIVGFVLFPTPSHDDRWEVYLNRINNNLHLGLSKEENCELINIQLDADSKCSMVVCVFKSKWFHYWP